MKTLLLTIFLASCGSLYMPWCGHGDIPVDDYFHGVDPEIEPYYERWQQRFGGDVWDIPANFAKLSDGRAGTCHVIRRNGRVIHREIRLDLRTWDNFSELRREALVWHELGHCLLGRGHLDDWVDGRPVSVMNTWLLQEHHYEKHYDWYQWELSNGQP